MYCSFNPVIECSIFRWDAFPFNKYNHKENAFYSYTQKISVIKSIVYYNSLEELRLSAENLQCLI